MKKETYQNSMHASKSKKGVGLNLKKIKGLAMLSSYRAWFKLLFAVAPATAKNQALALFATPFNQKVRPREKQVLAQSNHEKISFDGVNIQVYRWGKSSRKVLAVHGWEGNGGNFGAFIEPLLAKGYEVVAFDGPAHYQSEGKRTNLFQFSRLVAHLVAIEKPEVILAHSFGSGSSILALHDYPAVWVSKLVLLSCQDQLEEPVLNYTRLMKFNEKATLSLMRHMEHLFERKFEDLAMSKLLKAVSARVLLIHDTNDRVLPYHNSKQLKESNPDIELLPITQVGHYKMLWNDSVVNKVVDFL